MVIKIKNISFLLILAFFFLNGGCKKRCVEVNYSLKAFVNVSPSKDSLLVGDTLYFESKTSTLFYDYNNSRNVDFSGAINFGTALGIGELNLSADSIRGAINNFILIPLKGEFSSSALPQKVKQVKFVEESGFYYFKLGIVPKQKGIYSISLADATNTIHRSSKCEKANISVEYQAIDQHLHYLQDLYYKGAPIAQIDKTHVYCFQVF